MQSETTVRLVAFITMLTAVALAEASVPRRLRRQPRRRRWPANLAMVLLGAALTRLAVPLLAVEAALHAETAGFGLLNLVAWPGWLNLLIGVIVLDLVIYAQHVAFHRVPLLWRIHRMHHVDPDLDVTTGIRFHPIEFAISMVIKLGAVFLLGAPAAAVILFEVLLNATAMFNHANMRLPAALDRVLRTVLVTPDFHAVHHSVEPGEHNRNFGFNLPWWDYLFRTYKPKPDSGLENEDIGLRAWRGPEAIRLGALLWLPFAGPDRQAGSSPPKSGQPRSP